MSDQRDDDVAAVFDQTNGLAEGLQGESNGTAEGEEHSSAEQEQDPTDTDTSGSDDASTP